MWSLCSRQCCLYIDITSYNPTSATLQDRHYYPYFTGEATRAQRVVVTKVTQLASKPEN